MNDMTESDPEEEHRELLRLPAEAVLEGLDESEECVRCACCRRVVEGHEDVIEMAPAEWHCEDCAACEIEQIKREAKSFALAECKLTAPLPPYDPSQEYRVTP